MKLFLLGGFLGSGKTTAIQRACEILLKRNTRVGVITNDQGTQLVDSAFIRGHRIPGREVTEGCFCCNYDQLEEGIRSLTAEETPDIIFAESVGSCADIIATVVRPLLKFHPDVEIVYSVLADSGQLLNIAEGKPVFSDDDVNYIYEKQLEEADLLIVNKTDLLSGLQLEMISRTINIRYTGKSILFQSSLQEKDIEKWLETLQGFRLSAARRSLEIDYNKYGAGEAKLAWLDEETEITAEDFNAVEIAVALINKIYRKIQDRGFPIGHLKFLMRNGAWQRKISFTALDEPLLKETASPVQTEHLNLLINARVQTLPGILKEMITRAFEEIMQERTCLIESKKLSAFQPGFPRPFYRMGN
jgi:G3E family GTPase